MYYCNSYYIQNIILICIHNSGWYKTFIVTVTYQLVVTGATKMFCEDNRWLTTTTNFFFREIRILSHSECHKLVIFLLIS